MTFLCNRCNFIWWP